MAKSGLDAALATYLERWGPLRKWREDCALDKATSHPSFLGPTLDALATIETDSRVQYLKLRVAGLDNDPRIRQFLFPWLAEEAEHGRALRTLASVYGGKCDVHERDERKASVRNRMTWPGLVAVRPVRKYFEGAYCVLAMMQEHTALTTYQTLSRLIQPGNAGSFTLHEIARQEGRHMHFYRAAAVEFLNQPHKARVARGVVTQVWNPVGIDVLGRDAWWRAFGPMLASPEFRQALARLDAVVQSLPGFEDVQLVDRFLLRNENTIRGYECPEMRGLDLRGDALPNGFTLATSTED